MLKRFLVCFLLGAFAPLYAQEGAGNDSPNLINQLHQKEWVRLSEDGKVTGTLLTLGSNGKPMGRIGANIVLSMEGEVISRTKSDVRGLFTIEDVKPGTYAFQVAGDLTRAAFALHVLPAEASHLDSNLDVYAAIVPAQRAKELVSVNFTPEWDSQEAYYRNFAKDPIATERRFSNSHQVVLQDGNLVGRVSRPGWTYDEQNLTGTVAQIVREGKIVASTAVNESGYFTVENLKPGVYDLFAAGDDGFAILSFEAIASEESISQSKDTSVRFVSTNRGRRSNCLCCEMIQQPEISCCEVIVEPVCGCGQDPCSCGAIVETPSPIAGGGFAGAGGFYGGGGGGFGGGGGGGAGGFGGGAGLAGVAGLAIGIAALADDDNGFNQNAASGLAP